MQPTQSALQGAPGAPFGSTQTPTAWLAMDVLRHVNGVWQVLKQGAGSLPAGCTKEHWAPSAPPATQIVPLSAAAGKQTSVALQPTGATPPVQSPVHAAPPSPGPDPLPEKLAEPEDLLSLRE
jgi:hypothetical protein